MTIKTRKTDTAASENEIRGCDGGCAECVATDLEEMVQENRWDLNDLGRWFLQEMRLADANGQD